MSLIMFCVYHKDFYLREDNYYFTFFGVNESYRKEKKKNIILENELKIYDPFLQKRGYMETSAYLHVYWNKLYKDKKMIGFSQYDMKHHQKYDNLNTEVMYILNTNQTIVNNSKWNELMFPNIIDLSFLIKSYNRFFETQYTVFELENIPLSLWQTNIYPVKIYEKLCSWLEILVKEIYPWSNREPYQTHFGSIGGYTERALSIFNAYEIFEGIKYNNLSIDNHINSISEQYNTDMFLNNYSFDIHSSLMKLNKFDDVMWDKINLSYDEQTYIRGKPIKYLNETINLFNEMDGKIILEIGSCRCKMAHTIDKFDPNCCNDGHSTYFWKNKTNADVYTVDIDNNCKQIIDNDNRLDGVNAYTQDAIEFSKTFDKTIDLLFLDAWDVTPEYPYAEKHLELYETIKTKLSENCLILIDDTDILNGGKGKQLFVKLINDGYDILIKGRQTLFKKSNILKVTNEKNGNVSLIRKEIGDITYICLVIDDIEHKPIALNVDDSILFNKIENVLHDHLIEYDFFYEIHSDKITSIYLIKNSDIICKWNITISL